MAAAITETEVVWIAGLLGGGGRLREATPLPLHYDQVLQAVAAGVAAGGDVVDGMEDLQVDTLLERLGALSDDGRARLLMCSGTPEASAPAICASVCASSTSSRTCAT